MEIVLKLLPLISLFLLGGGVDSGVGFCLVGVFFDREERNSLKSENDGIEQWCMATEDF